MSEAPGSPLVAVRSASPGDLADLERLYRILAAEMTDLRPVWAFADALPEPAGPALAALLDADEWNVVVGTLDSHPVGFLAWRVEAMLPQSEGGRIAAIRFLVTEPAAREVGVGEAMIGEYLAGARRRGCRHLDAHVSPGHRLAKNFFESNGFKARSIVMHRELEP